MEKDQKRVFHDFFFTSFQFKKSSFQIQKYFHELGTHGPWGFGFFEIEEKCTYNKLQW